MTHFRLLRNLLSATKKPAVAFVMTTAIAVGAAGQTNTFPTSGNAGIGTTTPTEPLDINKNQNAGTALAVDNGYSSAGNAAYTGFWLRQGGANRFFLGANNDGNAAQNGGPGAVQFWNFVNGPMLFSTNNTERMRITGVGNVGIGTSTPSQSLHVRRDQNMGSSIYVENQTAGTQAQANFRAINDDGKIGQFGIYSSASSPYGLLVSNDVHVYSNSSLGLIAESATGVIKFATGGNSEKARIDAAGNVGIGISAPLTKIHASSASTSAPSVIASTDSSGNSGSGVALWSGWSGGGAPNTPALIWTAGRDLRLGGGITDLGTGWGFSETMRITSDGRVGIGTDTPTKKLHVAGDIQVDGNINAKYQDVAEWVPAAEPLPAGTVVVLDRSKSNQVISSTQSYDTRVAGVISAQPGITLGESGEGKVLVATTGRVRVKVDASRGAIQIGDLLVTSDLLGVAMKSEAVNLGGVQIHRPGTIIGKALEPLAKGTGEILVLLSLQ